MKRILSLLAVLLLLFTAVTAQADAYDFDDSDFGSAAPEVTEEEPDFVYKPNQQGDQFVRLNLALQLPVRPEQLRIGGTGGLSYGVFLSDGFSLSGKINFAYTSTIGGNIFYFIPFTFAAQYQFLLRNFELPVSVEIGAALQSYIDRLYFGIVVKPEAALFYRVSPDWSIGAYAGLYILPQLYSDSTYNYTGMISDVGLSVRYHF